MHLTIGFSESALIWSISFVYINLLFTSFTFSYEQISDKWLIRLRVFVMQLAQTGQKHVQTTRLNMACGYLACVFLLCGKEHKNMGRQGAQVWRYFASQCTYFIRNIKECEKKRKFIVIHRDNIMISLF